MNFKILTIAFFILNLFFVINAQKRQISIGEFEEKPNASNFWKDSSQAKLSCDENSAKSIETKRPKITGIANVAFFTKDINNTLQFYTDYLGFAEPTYRVMENGKIVNQSFIKINDRQFIEILPEKDSIGDRLSHFALETDNAEAMRQFLALNGVKVPETLTNDLLGNFSFCVTDPNGTICELIQYNSNSLTSQNFGKDMPETRISTHMKHMGFKVPEVDKALAFYRDILGLKEIWRGSKDGKNVHFVHLQVPEGDDFIELMLYDSKPTKEYIGILDHVGFEVTDVSVSFSILNSRKKPDGIKIPTELKTGINRKRQINYYDVDGSRIEIMEDHTIDGVTVSSSTLPPLKLVIK